MFIWYGVNLGIDDMVNLIANEIFMKKNGNNISQTNIWQFLPDSDYQTEISDRDLRVKLVKFIRKILDNRFEGIKGYAYFNAAAEYVHGIFTTLSGGNDSSIYIQDSHYSTYHPVYYPYSTRLPEEIKKLPRTFLLGIEGYEPSPPLGVSKMNADRTITWIDYRKGNINQIDPRSEIEGFCKTHNLVPDYYIFNSKVTRTLQVVLSSSFNCSFSLRQVMDAINSYEKEMEKDRKEKEIERERMVKEMEEKDSEWYNKWITTPLEISLLDLPEIPDKKRCLRPGLEASISSNYEYDWYTDDDMWEMQTYDNLLAAEERKYEEDYEDYYYRRIEEGEREEREWKIWEDGYSSINDSR